MKESVFDVLMYLFENYMSDEAAAEMDQDREALKSELLRAGFHDREIGKALDWLEGLSALQHASLSPPVKQAASMRIYSAQELERLDLDSRGFLLFLEQMGVLDHTTREMVVDRAMALEGTEMDLDQLKWVILMVLFNQPGREAAFAWMEDLVLDDMTTTLH
jgi:Smg protein